MNKPFRSSDDVQANITAVCAKIQELKNELPVLREEMQKSMRIEGRLEMFEALNYLGTSLGNARWQRVSTSRIYNPHIHTDDVSVESYSLRILHRDIEMKAGLNMFSGNKWALEYSLSRYGTSIRADGFNGEDRAGAKAWGKEELNKKLIAIKKQLMKDLKGYI